MDRHNKSRGWVKDALGSQFHVMRAVALHDMRTRFFNHGLGFLVVSLWPLAHMILLLLIYRLGGRHAPFGESLNVFFASGLIPTLLFTYVSRFMCLSLVLNKQLLNLPVVRVMDVMLARAFLEVIAGAMTLVFLVIVLWASGDDPFPYDIEQAVLCYLATLLLALGVGSIAGVITMFAPFFATVYALMMIIVYAASGTLFVTNALPEPVANALSWSPVVQSVEWMRTAFFETYSDRLVNKSYLFGFGLASLFLGLLLERLLRMKMLES